MEREGYVFQEAESAIPGWSSLNFGSEIQANELNCFLNPDWQSSMDLITDPFESPLSSMVSSPVASTAVTKGELVGNPGELELSAQSYIYSANNSCYNTPLSSPLKLNLSTAPTDRQMNPNLAAFSADPGFVDRAAKFSRFGDGDEDFGPANHAFGFDDSRFPYKLLSKCAKLTAVSSKMKNQGGISRSSLALEATELGDSREASSISEPKDLNNDRKRKPRTKDLQSPPNAPKNIIKAASGNEESIGKSSKSVESRENENMKEGNQKQVKVPEPLKDFIHVRARRGQATDSHSLAERVRREKISERMKLLQDLVPGCNKVTGKAVMLDEIINYVQSLQRQVEFLSMKLATINPEGELNMEALLSKDFNTHHSQLPQSAYQLDPSPYGLQCQQQQFPVNGFKEASPQVCGAFWEDDLQSVVQMGVAPNQPQSFHGSAGPMKIEL